MPYFTVRGPMAIPAAGGLLLDSISGSPLVAYSSRKLRSAYAGNDLKVYQTLSTVLTDIGFTGNDLDTGALATAIGANTGLIDTWYDQSTNANNARPLAGLSTKGPMIVNAGTNQTKNGHVAPNFNTGDAGASLLTPNLAISEPNTICAVVQQTSNSIWTDGTVAREFIATDPATVYTIFAGSAGVTGGTGDTNIHGFICYFDNAGAGNFLYVDNTAVISADNTAGTGGINQQVIGNDTVSASAINGFVCEFLIFPGIISSSDRATIRSSWASYWGTP